jgi:hypothetical protein
VIGRGRGEWEPWPSPWSAQGGHGEQDREGVKVLREVITFLIFLCDLIKM